MAEDPTKADAGDGGGDVDGSLEGGNYEVIRQRLLENGKTLAKLTEQLNETRKNTFGGSELTPIATENILTEHNCVPRDIVCVKDQLLFGYNVFMGLKQQTGVDAVFALHRFEPAEGGFECSAWPLDALGGFLTDEQFQKEFGALYKYYRDAQLLRLQRSDTELKAVFQQGAEYTDIKVFRWRIEGDGSITYRDDRGAPDYKLPPGRDFEWTELGREDQVKGVHPHLNVADTLFVDNTGGDLTIKIENNTETGEGIYAEPLDDRNQVLDDAEFYYYRGGGLILLKFLPFRETRWRYLIYNERTQKIVRVDAIGQACLHLPENHGIIFPGGYFLQSGEYKVFDMDVAGLNFDRLIKSPNGEDVLYVFHRPSDGHYELFPYNLIRKEVQKSISCHGYSLFDDGRLVVFRSTSDEPRKSHPMQVWQTPFMSVEAAAAVPKDGSFLANVGNAELVRGISEMFTVTRLINADEPTRQTYEDIVRNCTRVIDGYYWLDHEEVGIKDELAAVRRTAELIIGEFEKVIALRDTAKDALQKAEDDVEGITAKLRSEAFNKIEPFLEALTTIRSQRGHIITLREVRYIDLARLEELEQVLVEHFDRVSRDCVTYLLRDEAFAPLKQSLDQTLAKLDDVHKVADVEPLRESVNKTAEGLDLLSEVVSNLQIEDTTQRTSILESISEVFAHVNRVRATIEGRYRELQSHEGKAEFGAQFKLLGQSVSSSLTMCDTPERCDEEQARIMIQLEELESRFSDFDEFLADLAAKREEIYDAFGGRKQTLLDERQRRAQNIIKAAERILEGVGRRTKSLGSADDVNGYFAADAMVLKLRQLAEQLADIGDSVKSEEILAKLKTARQDALRGLRDRLELFDEGAANIIKFGSHRFTVNTQPLELSMVSRDEGMALHMGGTDFYELIDDEQFNQTKKFWAQDLVSETPQVYRGEYLAASILFAAERGESHLTVQKLLEAMRSEGDELLKLVRNYAQERYDEGYERGLHDADGTLILHKVLSMRETVGLLRFAAKPRSLAVLFWAWCGEAAARDRWHRQARNLGRLRTAFADDDALAPLAEELTGAMAAFFDDHSLPHMDGQGGVTRPDLELAGNYLAEELTAEQPRFAASAGAAKLRDDMVHDLEARGLRAAFEDDLSALSDNMAEQLRVAYSWISGFVASKKPDAVIDSLEAAVLLCSAEVDRETVSAVTQVEIKGLLGHHPRIKERTIVVRIDEFLSRLRAFASEHVPGYRTYRQLRTEVVSREKERLRLEEFLPKVMSSFVRNKLINDVYLPIIGDNLAKQIGTAGDKKRTDLMGMLLLISPPGYGKTTLMEYIASRLGLVFVKVNGPSLGHEVHSLDPAEAPNATARQEVNKINLAFEMGNNVMLYLDDIQHTHPELLQKFISLCDAQRRIEGVWKGRTRTYDMRGKKFCVVMAGNPYTESGDKFQIPDMLANRADIYNLGDILHGKGDLFALSYIENALTSNSTLAPLAMREQSDVYKLVRMAKGEQVASSELEHGYSEVELNDILNTLRHLFRCQQVLLAVNQQYIQSAAQDDKFRTEPPFKLQGSYRNMAKLAEKLVPANTEEEVETLIDDHYLGESQTLTTEAEQNLLKLAEMRGRLTEAQAARWSEIKDEFVRVKRMGGGDDDPVARVTGTLTGLSEELERINKTLAAGTSSGLGDQFAAVSEQLSGINQALATRLNGDSQQMFAGLVEELRGIRTAASEAAKAGAAAGGKAQSDNAYMPLEPILAAIEKLRTPQVSVPVPMQQMFTRLTQLLEHLLRSGNGPRGGGSSGGGGGSTPPAGNPVVTGGGSGGAPPSPYSGHSAHGSRGYTAATPEEREAYEKAVAQYREQYRQQSESRQQASPQDTLRGRPATKK